MADIIVVAADRDHHQTQRRSTTGCWTCRLRRKKCDERREECLTCRSLYLNCAGYGAKPAWMDGGELEKEKAQEIKAEVHRGRKRGRRRQRNQTQRKSGLQPSTSNGIGTPARHSLSLSIDTGINANEDPLPCQITPVEPVQRDVAGQTSPITIRPLAQLSPPAASELNIDPISQSLCQVSPPTTEDDIAGSLASLSSLDMSVPMTGIDVQTLDWDVFMDSSVPTTATEVFTGDDVFRFEPLDSSCTIMSELTSTVTVPLHKKPSIQLDTDVANMIEHYVSDVFPNMFPFLDERLHTVLRNALIASEMDVNAPTRTSTLALGTRMKAFGLERMGLSMDSTDKDAADRWKLEATNQIKSAVQFVNDESLSNPSNHRSGAIALSLLQLNLLQIRQGTSDHNTLAGLVEAVVGRHKLGINDDDLIANFACNVMVVIDILWSVSKRRRPLLTSDHASITSFNMVGSDVTHATGSQLWVFHYIAEITLLRFWKADQAASHTLNITELAQKAAVIGPAIQEQRRKISSALTCQTNKDALLITDIYAAAAQIYLNVVISGAFPEVSDIRQAVENTMDAIKRLSNAVLMRRLAWPICVAASLAEPRHETFFNTLEVGAQADQEGCTSVLRGLIVARECRKLRQESSTKGASFDWMDALDSLGHEWILF